MEFQKHLAQEEDDSSEMESDEVLANEDMGEEEVVEEKKMSSSSIRHTFSQGEMAMSRKDLDEAVSCFLAVIESDETHLDAHLKLGLICMKQEDFAKAELYFAKLVNLKKDPVYFSNLGASLYQQQRLLEAAEAYENAIALDDKRANRLQSLAQVYHELGDKEKALKYFELASKRKPKDNDLKIVLAEYYRQMERFEEAVMSLDKVLESDPYNDEVKSLIRELKEEMKG
jgi:tetratricopeptide (TPR) repeat protein